MTSRLLIRSALLVALAAAVALASCSKRSQIKIESDTCWNGMVNGFQGISGCGNASYTVTGRLDCVTIGRSTANGFVRIRIDARPWAETTSNLSVIEVCK